MHTKDTIQVRTESGTLYVAPPRRFTGLSPALPAQLEIHDQTLSLFAEDAELLARTVAPQLFPEEGTEPWRKPIRETYVDLSQTVRSYGRDLFASREANWDAGALTQSLSGLLDALQGTLDRLEKLL
jgi:hypothetical protein